MQHGNAYSKERQYYGSYNRNNNPEIEKILASRLDELSLKALKLNCNAWEAEYNPNFLKKFREINFVKYYNVRLIRVLFKSHSSLT